jgi:hypothetical protein
LQSTESTRAIFVFFIPLLFTTFIFLVEIH